MSHARGKALIYIFAGREVWGEKKLCVGDVSISVISCSATGPYALDWVRESLTMALHYAQWPVKGLQEGQWRRIVVTYTIRGYTSYEGEYDEDVEFPKWKVRKTGPVPKKRERY